MKFFYQKVIIGFVILLIVQCKEAYEPAVQSSIQRYLVVEGFLNANGPTTIKISKTSSVLKNEEMQPEVGAQVRVESTGNSVHTLSGNTNGEYTANIPVNINEKYRLLIKTSNGKEYASAFVPVLKTPAIDSISWVREKNGVQIYANTHNPANNTRYYKWEYEETWEIIPEYRSKFDVEEFADLENPVPPVIYIFHPRDPDRFPRICWGSAKSSQIILGSSIKLSEDRIYLSPLTYIPPTSEKVVHKYSILVKQHAISREAFDFLQNMKKNTEELGSIFDPQPSESRGNISCLTNPDELIIGYFTANTVEEKRIFIKNEQVPGWEYDSGCFIKCPENDERPCKYEEIFPAFIPLYRKVGGGYTSADRKCVDCRLRGGDPVKPDFWQ